MSFPTGDQSDCDCEGVARFLTSIPVGMDGSLAMEAYTIDLRCTIGLNIKMTWDGSAWVSDPFNVILEDGGGNVSCILTMTAGGTAPEDVEVLLEREAGGDVAKWVNKPLWQPHRAVRMKRIWHDLTCDGISWNPYPCLIPSGVAPPCEELGYPDVLYWLIKIPANYVSSLPPYASPGIVAAIPTNAASGGFCSPCYYRALVTIDGNDYQMEVCGFVVRTSLASSPGIGTENPLLAGSLGDNPGWDTSPPEGWWEWPHGFPAVPYLQLMAIYDDTDEEAALDCTGCDPEDVTADKTFTISAVDYTIEKGGTAGDECDGHCWGNGPDITLTWTDGVWELHYFSDIYTVEAGACELTLFMDKFSGSGPDTLTVYTV